MVDFFNEIYPNEWFLSQRLLLFSCFSLLHQKITRRKSNQQIKPVLLSGWQRGPHIYCSDLYFILIFISFLNLFINHFSSDFLFGWQMGHRVFSFDFLFCLSLTFHLSFILNFFLNFIVGFAEGPRPIYFFASNNLSTSRRAKAKSLQSGNQYVSKFEQDWPKYKQLYTCIIFIIERTWLKKVQLRPDHIIKILGTSSLPRYSWLFSKCFQ